MSTRLTEAEIVKNLESVPGWSLEDGKLFREFNFPSFVEAFGFMASVAIIAEKQNHHPAQIADLVIVGVDRVGIYDAIPYVVGAVLLSLLTLTQRVWFHVAVFAAT